MDRCIPLSQSHTDMAHRFGDEPALLNLGGAGCAGRSGQVVKEAKQSALAKMTVFPMFMLACYIGLILYFKSRGGYRPVELQDQEAS